MCLRQNVPHGLSTNKKLKKFLTPNRNSIFLKLLFEKNSEIVASQIPEVNILQVTILGLIW